MTKLCVLSDGRLNVPRKFDADGRHFPALVPLASLVERVRAKTVLDFSELFGVYRDATAMG